MSFHQVVIFSLLILLINHPNSVIGVSFNIINKCDITIWPGIRGKVGPNTDTAGQPGSIGYVLMPGTSITFQAQSTWSGRIWGRTGCNFEDSNQGFCTTGDCGTGQIQCNGSVNTISATRAEFGIGQPGTPDFYDVTLVDGFNLPILVEPKGGVSPGCTSTGCTTDLNQICPTELRAEGGVGCKGPCEVFGKPEYCCTGEYSSPSKCVPTNYSRFFKSNCPQAYSYPFDDQTSTFNCTAPNYDITFCSQKATDDGLVPGLPPFNSPDIGGKKGMSVPLTILIIVLIVVVFILLSVAFVCFKRRSKKRLISSKDAEEIPIIESLNYSLSQVQNATNNFSEDCKIGQGGFGHVYKGTLPNGQEVAMKRLSKSSMQGLEEFKNEILVLAKLQHRNLVRLLGFCFENQEMILIFEFFRNKSLDHFLFDPDKRQLLDWTTRRVIIGGIARGLLYLHEDSRLKIIHRDLKASNVLLDDNMNPKIADFGTARLLQLDQSEENTVRIAGTYGYMAPEYAIYGQISVKSDVFSFGVLLLEIISGQKNNDFYQSNGVDDLRSYAWKNFINGIPLALLDPSVGEIYTRSEVIHCIHVGLLCVQEDPQSRPTMDSVVLMLNNNIVTLPIPLEPAFFITRHAQTGNVLQPEQHDTVSRRDASFTELYPR